MTNFVMAAAVIGAGMLISASQGASAAGFTIEGDLDAMTLNADQTPSKDIVAEIAKRFSLGIQNASGGTAAISGRFNGDLNHILKAILPRHNYAIAYRDGRPSRITFIGGTAAASTFMGDGTAALEGSATNGLQYGDGAGREMEGSVPAAAQDRGPARDSVIIPGQDPFMSNAGNGEASQSAVADEVAPSMPIGWDPDAPIQAGTNESAGAEASEAGASPVLSPENPAAMAETVPEASGVSVPPVLAPDARSGPPALPDQTGSTAGAPG